MESKHLPEGGGKWHEEDGAISFSVTSRGTTGEDWITHLTTEGFCVEDYALGLLRSPYFKPTKGVTTEVIVVKGILFENNDRNIKNIRADGASRHLFTPNAEVACLIREKFTDKEIEAMGLIWIVVMHESIKDADSSFNLLCVSRLGRGRWLEALQDWPGRIWDRRTGYAFVVSQVRS
jgi:hypothetical protein